MVLIIQFLDFLILMVQESKDFVVSKFIELAKANKDITVMVRGCN